MLDNLVTPIVAIAVILGITFPIWLLVLAARFVQHVGRIAGALERLNESRPGDFGAASERGLHAIANSMFGR